jgi:hypothetical protein
MFYTQANFLGVFLIKASLKPVLQLKTITNKLTHFSILITKIQVRYHFHSMQTAEMKIVEDKNKVELCGIPGKLNASPVQQPATPALKTETEKKS